MQKKDSSSKASKMIKSSSCKGVRVATSKPYKSTYSPMSRGVSSTKAIKLLKEFSQLK